MAFTYVGIRTPAAIVLVKFAQYIAFSVGEGFEKGYNANEIKFYHVFTIYIITTRLSAYKMKTHKLIAKDAFSNIYCLL